MLCTLSGHSWTAPSLHSPLVQQIPTKARSLYGLCNELHLSSSPSCIADMPVIYACRVDITAHMAYMQQSAQCSVFMHANPPHQRNFHCVAPASQECSRNSLRMSGLSLAVSRSVRRCSFFLKCSSSSEDSACRALQDPPQRQSATALLHTLASEQSTQLHDELQGCKKMRGASALSGKEAYRASVHALL